MTISRTAALVIAGLAAGLAAAAIGLGLGLRMQASEHRPLDPADERLVAEGEALYAHHCASCHGRDLEGEPDWQTPLDEGVYPAPPHDETGHTWHHDDALLFTYTRDGGAALGLPGFESRMPGFGETLSEAEIWAVLSFIKAQWPPEIQAVQDDRNAATLERER